jgi:hypothetical protein
MLYILLLFPLVLGVTAAVTAFDSRDSFLVQTKLNVTELFPVGFQQDKVYAIWKKADATQPRPTAENKTSGYAFTVNIDKVTSIASGWHVHVAPFAKPILENNDRLWTTIGVLGYYSKGKSFCVTQLYRAGRGLLDTDNQAPTQGEPLLPSLLPTFFGSSTASALVNNSSFEGNDEISLATGPQVTTIGISAVFTGFPTNSTPDNAEVVIFDTAGRNAPAERRLNESKAVESINALIDEISELRSKERMLDDIVLSVSDTVFYVIDELLNEDQRTILHIIKRIASGSDNPKTLCILHNWKNKIRMVSDNSVGGLNIATPAFISGQTKEPFSAKRISLPPQQEKLYGKLDIWKSEWRMDHQEIVTVFHFAIYDNTQESEYNNRLFRYLSSFAADVKKHKNSMHGSPLYAISEAAGKFYGSYVFMELIDSGECPHDEVDPLRMKQGSHGGTHDAIIKAHIPDKYKLALKPWEIREMPHGSSSGTWIPKTESYLANDTFIYRVEVPGFDGSCFVIGKDAPDPAEGSFIRIRRQESDASFADRQFYQVSGRREKDPLAPTDEGSGTFFITFGHPMSHSIPKGGITLKNGVFQFKSIKKQDEFEY